MDFLPKMFADVIQNLKTPYKTLFIMVLVGLSAAFVPGDIGRYDKYQDLICFNMLVCAGYNFKENKSKLPRQFKTALVPLVPILGIVVCAAMIFGLS
jgi:APA family basic amino acid/polyamine antiporter